MEDKLSPNKQPSMDKSPCIDIRFPQLKVDAFSDALVYLASKMTGEQLTLILCHSLHKDIGVTLNYFNCRKSLSESAWQNSSAQKKGWRWREQKLMISN